LGALLAAQAIALPGAAEEPPLNAVPVGAAAAVAQDLKVYIDALGTIQAFNTVAIHPQVDGQLVKVVFKDGQDVHAGDLLGQIDPRPYQASLDQALAKRAQDAAQLDNAVLDLRRYASLVERDAVSRQVVDAAQYRVTQLEAAIKGDEAAIEAARIQLGFTDMRAPVDGQAGIRQIDQGNILHGGGPGSSSGSTQETLVVITQVQPIFVVFTIAQKDLARLVSGHRKGRMSVAVLSKEDNRLIEEGALEAIDNQVDPATGTIKLKARLANAERTLWPGEYVNVRLLVETKPKAVTVPANAVQAGPQGSYVFAVTQGETVETRFVTAGTVSGGVAEITQGLEAGEIVVVSGHYRLRPGIKVAIHGLQARAEGGNRP
jgi:multidrug efflux system membrane fusion protein